MNQRYAGIDLSKPDQVKDAVAWAGGFLGEDVGAEVGRRLNAMRVAGCKIVENLDDLTWEVHNDVHRDMIYAGIALAHTPTDPSPLIA